MAVQIARDAAALVDKQQLSWTSPSVLSPFFTGASGERHECAKRWCWSHQTKGQNADEKAKPVLIGEKWPGGYQ